MNNKRGDNMNVYVPFFEFDLETAYFEGNEKRAVYIFIYFENRIEAPDIKAALDIADRSENALRKDIKVYYDYTADQLCIETQSTKIYKTEYISDSFYNSPDQKPISETDALSLLKNAMQKAKQLSDKAINNFSALSYGVMRV